MTGAAGELARVTAELRACPRPVAGCDAQFNHLPERRAAREAARREGVQPAQTERGT
jgi:hypothetical protein